MNDEFLNKFPINTFTAEQVILTPGEIPKNLYFLKKGFVRQFVNSSEGKELTIHIYAPDSVFPLMWGLNDFTPDYSLQAVTDGEYVAINREGFLEYLRQNTDFEMKLLKNLVAGLSGLSKRLEIASLESAETKVKQILLYLAKHFGESTAQGIVVQNHFTHEQIAALTGLSRERVTLELGKLREAEIIAKDSRSIQIFDLTKLL